MYKMTGYVETCAEAMTALMNAHPLATVFTSGDGLAAYHVPFEIGAPTLDSPHGVLRAHLGRPNPLLRQDGQPMLVVFNGPSGYVSPSLYEEKPLHGKVVPTYDYAVVHVHGTLKVIDDAAWMLALLNRMTNHFEGGRAMPWSIEDAPREFIDKLLGHLVGIEIPIARIEGMRKMSQNKSLGTRRAIAEDVPAIAGLVLADLHSGL